MTHAHDPKTIGPGCWSTWHISSVDSDPTLFLALCVHFRDKFKCLKCREEIKIYMLRDSPFELKKEINDDGKDISRAKWLWIFHNCVNQRLQKPIYSWSEFLREYFLDNVCSSDCGEQHSDRSDEKKESSSNGKKYMAMN